MYVWTILQSYRYFRKNSRIKTKTQGKTLIGRNFMKIHTAKINILSLKPKYKTPNSREKTQLCVKNRPWIKDKDYCTMYSRNKNVN